MIFKMGGGCHLAAQLGDAERSARLSEAYDCIEPYDVVTAVFDDNIGAIGKLAEFILDLYGMQDVVDDVKN